MECCMKMDYIIVGQGLAGTILAFELLSKGQKIVVIDKDISFDSADSENISSRIAAGVINPITGKRYVKSWKIDDLLPVARQTYTALESLLGIPIFNEKLFVRTLKNIEDENQWLLKSSYEEYENYCEADVYPPSVYPHFSDDFRALVRIKQAATVNIKAMLQASNQYLKAQDCFYSDVLDYSELKIKDNTVFYKNFKARKIIFCEGAKAIQNPYFNYLPFNLDKGELLLVKIPDLNMNDIFKYNLSIAPLGNDMYWVGATNSWSFNDDKPTHENRELMIKELRDILKLPFEVISHKAAIRPTVKDRRPFIGFHPQYPELAIFNGMGTKGASLVPYWAKHFTTVLVDNEGLDKDVDIKRFKLL